MEYLKLFTEIALGIFLFDRLGLWLESKGWLYYRKKKPSGGAGNALQELDAFFRPSARQTIEMKQKDSRQRDDQCSGANSEIKS